MSERLGKYRLIQLLATGGMGEVFLARHEGPAGFSKTVVIKKILRHLAHDQSFIDMFLNEARLAAQLTHPNIVQIFELGQEDETWFIAMEFVHGRSLRVIKQQLLDRKEVMAPWVAARLCSQALQGLHYAHTLTDERSRSLGIIHRDVSPDNVLVTFGGVVKLVDFGIAKAMNAASTTRTGTLKGKFAYMAPEQLQHGGTIDARTDVYSMGVLLYELLTGSRPHSAETEANLLTKMATRPITPPVERNPNLPTMVNDIILHALHKDSALRFSTAEEFANALEAYIASTGETLTTGHVGSFLKELFGSQAAMTNPSVSTVPPGPDSGPKKRKSTGGKMRALPSGTAVFEQPRSNGPMSEQSLAIIGNAATVVRSNPDAMPGNTAEEPTRFDRIEPDTDSDVSKRRPRPFWKSPLLFAGGGGAVAMGLVLLFAFREPEPAPTTDLLPVVVVTTDKRPTEKPPPVETPVEKDKPSEKTGAEAVPAVGNAAADSAVESARGTVEKTEARPPKVNRPKKDQTPKPGKVIVRVNPYADVFLKGRFLGTTPIEPVEVPAGMATFVLKNTALKKEKKVSVLVPSGGEVVLKYDMFEEKKPL